jgi:hypothetical protein
MKKINLLAAICMFPALGVYGQSIGPGTLNAAGGSRAIGPAVYDWSVGEMAMVGTFTTPAIVITQGVLQPYTLPPSGTENFTPPATHLKVFPNPVTSEVNLEYSSSGNGTLTYRFMDAAGKAVTERTINVAPGIIAQKIDVSGLASATYLLEIFVDPTGGIPGKATYKIEKLK